MGNGDKRLKEGSCVQKRGVGPRCRRDRPASIRSKLEQKKDRYAKSKWLNDGHIRFNSKRGMANDGCSDFDPSGGGINCACRGEAGSDVSTNPDKAIKFTTQHCASVYEVNTESELLKGPKGDKGNSGEKGEPGATHIEILIRIFNPLIDPFSILLNNHQHFYFMTLNHL